MCACVCVCVCVCLYVCEVVCVVLWMSYSRGNGFQVTSSLWLFVCSLNVYLQFIFMCSVLCGCVFGVVGVCVCPVPVSLCACLLVCVCVCVGGSCGGVNGDRAK